MWSSVSVFRGYDEAVQREQAAVTLGVELRSKHCPQSVCASVDSLSYKSSPYSGRCVTTPKHFPALCFYSRTKKPSSYTGVLLATVHWRHRGTDRLVEEGTNWTPCFS